MQLWAVEYGSLWALETGDGLPPVSEVRPGTEFKELKGKDIDGLVDAMNLPDSHTIHRRMQGDRRCFILRERGEIVAYGWVSFGPEYVGELERQLNLKENEAYIWDCRTLPARRGNGFYTFLLVNIIHQLHNEGVPLIWIGASRKNRPSVRGIASAGFRQVVNLTYRRLFRLTLVWLHKTPPTGLPLIKEAHRILFSDRERRFGRLAVGYNG